MPERDQRNDRINKGKGNFEEIVYRNVLCAVKILYCEDIQDLSNKEQMKHTFETTGLYQFLAFKKIYISRCLWNKKKTYEKEYSYFPRAYTFSRGPPMPMTHGAAGNKRFPFLSVFAVFLAVSHVSSLFTSLFSTMSLWVVPFLYPVQSTSKLLRIRLSFSWRNQCIATSSFPSLLTAVSCLSLQEVTIYGFGQNTPFILPGHLVWKVSGVRVTVCVIFQHSPT